MKVFGSELSRYTRNLSKVHRYAWYFLQCSWIFRQPVDVIRWYLTRTLPAGGTVALRNGLVLHLSDDPCDIVTLFVVFVRRDYGRVVPGTVVVDVGANIGVFALYAAQSGARAVHAYEPNATSFECLRRNVVANRLEHVIFAHRLAVAGEEGRTVRFPRKPSVHNAILAEGVADEHELVTTTTLAAIVRPLEPVDLLKLDCEGGEYDILFGADASVFSRIRAIKLEYHKGRKEELAATLGRHGFARTRLETWNERVGNVWFSKVNVGR